jgi:dipeptidyl aminopeptidase/acylaminoacyl peptidase
VTAPLTKVERIPLDVLFGNPERTSPAVSPDGRKLAYLAPVDGVLNVWVGDMGGDDFAPVTSDADRGIRQFAFAHDNEHLIYIQDQGGDENWRLYTVDLETREVVDRTPFDQVQARVVATSKRRPHELLLGLNVDNKQLHDVYHLDLRTGELAKVAENPGFLGWIVDYGFAVRGAIRPTGDGGREVLVRDTADDEWRTVVTFDADDGELSGPVGFTRDGGALLLRSAIGVNAARLVSLDLATGAEDEIIADANYDVAGVVRHGDTWDVQIVSFLKDRVDMVVIDEAIAADIAALRALEEGELSLIDRDHGDTTWIVGFGRDDGPTRYFAWNRTTKAATFLFEDRSDLGAYQLAKMEPITFAARDGLEIHGYITFPVGADRSNLPCVLMVHGGPWSRDMWGFQPYAQWMANRGWVCLQINYRGSIGYGKEFVNAGDREWAAKMHDDLLDGIDWAVSQGYIDADRVAIMGGSYGGYAALVGATFTPDVFRCAVDIVGPSNLITLIESFPAYWKPNIARWHRRVGNPETERDFLWARSPLSRVDDIQIPMLIGQGANDPRVTQIESEQIVDAMKAKGIDHEYLLFEDEGHGFAKPENRLRFMEAADAFLAKHL